MEWLRHDEVALAELPEWARASAETLDGGPFEVKALAEGLVLRRGRRASVVLWEEILVPVRLDEPRRLLLAAARKPPLPPWFELDGADVARIEREVRTRLDALSGGTYREQRQRRCATPPDVVLDRVLRHDPLPGAVEIPIARTSLVKGAIAPAVVGGGLLGLIGIPLGPLGVLAAGSLGAAGAAGLYTGISLLFRERAGRVLVLTPDAFVAGLDGRSIRAVPWEGVGRFSDGIDPQGERALEVFGPRDQLVARVDARYFGKPLDVIVAVAEGYRRRAVHELA